MFKELSNDMQFDTIPSSGSVEMLSRLRTLPDTFVQLQTIVSNCTQKKTMNEMLNELSNSVAYQLGALNSQKYEPKIISLGRHSLSGTWALELWRECLHCYQLAIEV
jgi:hypothetical protein